MQHLPYKTVMGHRRNAQLLWVPTKKHIYVKKEGEWICYQTILLKSDSNAIKCTSRVQTISDSLCIQKNVFVPHTNHEDHEKIYNDLISRNKIIDQCVEMKNLSDGLTISIPSKDIFTRKMAR